MSLTDLVHVTRKTSAVTPFTSIQSAEDHGGDRGSTAYADLPELALFVPPALAASSSASSTAISAASSSSSSSSSAAASFPAPKPTLHESLKAYLMAALAHAKLRYGAGLLVVDEPAARTLGSVCTLSEITEVCARGPGAPEGERGREEGRGKEA